MNGLLGPVQSYYNTLPKKESDCPNTWHHWLSNLGTSTRYINVEYYYEVDPQIAEVSQIRSISYLLMMLMIVLQLKGPVYQL